MRRPSRLRRARRQPKKPVDEAARRDRRKKMSKRNHRPLRTCVGCRERDDKVNLVRIAARNDSVTVDYSGRLSGRGGDLHARQRCIDGFVEAKPVRLQSFKRALDRDQRLQLGEMIGLLLASKPTVD